MNEKFAFKIANGFLVTSNYPNYARTFLARDVHTGTWDGSNVYIHA